MLVFTEDDYTAPDLARAWVYLEGQESIIDTMIKYILLCYIGALWRCRPFILHRRRAGWATRLRE
jgi:hypothetical protein